MLGKLGRCRRSWSAIGAVRSTCYTRPSTNMSKEETCQKLSLLGWPEFCTFFWGWVVQFGKFMTEEWMVARENFHIFKWKTFSNWQNGDFARWDEIYQGQWFLRRVRAAKVEREKSQCHRGHAENIQASTCTDVACFFLYDLLVLMILHHLAIFPYSYVWFVYLFSGVTLFFFFEANRSRSPKQAFFRSFLVRGNSCIQLCRCRMVQAVSGDLGEVAATPRCWHMPCAKSCGSSLKLKGWLWFRKGWNHDGILKGSRNWHLRSQCLEH